MMHLLLNVFCKQVDGYITILHNILLYCIPHLFYLILQYLFVGHKSLYSH